MKEIEEKKLIKPSDLRVLGKVKIRNLKTYC